MELLHFSLRTCSSITALPSSEVFARLRAYLLRIIFDTYNFKQSLHQSFALAATRRKNNLEGVN